MKRNLSFALLIVCLMSGSLNIFAQKTKRPAFAPPIVAAQKKVDLGTLRGNTYTNDFFQLKIEFPLGWLVGDNVLEAQLKEIAQAQIKTRNPSTQSAMIRAVDRVTPLLGGYKALPGTPENPNLRVMVEDLIDAPQVKTGSDYLARVEATMKLTVMPSNFFYSEIKTETIDDTPLDYIETTAGSNKKRLYVTVRKGYAILMAIDYYETADFDALHEVLSKADLDYKK